MLTDPEHTQSHQWKVKEIQVAKNPPVTAVSLHMLLKSLPRNPNVCRFIGISL